MSAYILGYSGYILMMEFRQFIDQGSKYFEMPSFIWNFLDIFSSSLVILFLALDLFNSFSSLVPDVVLRGLAAIVTFLLWLKFFSYLRIFNSFSSFIRMIMEMFKDMGIFLTMLLLGILSFANTYYVLDQVNDN